MIKIIVSGNNDLSNPNLLTSYLYSGKMLPVTIFCTGFLMVLPIVYCTLLEKRNITTLGIVKKDLFKNYILGIIIGFVMFSVVYGIEYLTGSVHIDKYNGFNIWLLAFLVAFFFQSAGEEFMCRGFLLTSVGAKKSVSCAIIISSLAFSLMHLGNESFSFLASLNIFLFGALMALVYICSENIWVVSGIHGIWNYAQGNIFGISVSGMNIDNSIITSSQVVGKEIINGGGFGAEGGIVTTFVLLITILITIIYMKKKNKINI